MPKQLLLSTHSANADVLAIMHGVFAARAPATTMEKAPYWGPICQNSILFYRIVLGATQHCHLNLFVYWLYSYPLVGWLSLA